MARALRPLSLIQFNACNIMRVRGWPVNRNQVRTTVHVLVNRVAQEGPVGSSVISIWPVLPFKVKNYNLK